jgi:predicted transcriptional regulator
MSTIRRQNRTRNFTTVDNTGINDTRLSWKAKGLLVYLLSKPDDWQVYVSQLKTASKDGRDSTANGLEELVKFGYVKKEEKRAENGQFGYDYEVYEQPIKVEKGNTDTDKPLRKTRNGKTVTENTELLNTERPSTEKLKTDRENTLPSFLDRGKTAKAMAQSICFESKEEMQKAIAENIESIANYLNDACAPWRAFTPYQKKKYLEEYCSEFGALGKEYGNHKMNWQSDLKQHLKNRLNYQSKKTA